MIQFPVIPPISSLTILSFLPLLQLPWLPCSSSYTPSTLQPQGLCTCLFSLGCSYSRGPLASSHFFQGSAQKLSQSSSRPTYVKQLLPPPLSNPLTLLYFFHNTLSPDLLYTVISPQNISTILSSLLFSQHREQHPTHNRCSINICGMNGPVPSAEQNGLLFLVFEMMLTVAGLVAGKLLLCSFGLLFLLLFFSHSLLETLVKTVGSYMWENTHKGYKNISFLAPFLLP